MPISIRNSFPSISLHISIPDNNENHIRILVDTGATMNKGNLDYHLWVVSQCPGMVDEYLQCGKDTTYDVVNLLADLNLKDTYQNVDHGKMMAVIRYKAPYIIQGRVPFILSFNLGHDGITNPTIYWDIHHFTFWLSSLHRNQLEIFTYFRTTV